jgi:type II secretory pathway pseudopilin PulG
MPLHGEAANFHSARPRRFRAGGFRCAFTITEILIVVFALAILATVVIPQFSRASRQSQQNNLKDVIQYLRTQIAVFKAQHQDIPPGYPSGDPMATPTEPAFVTQMTLHSDVSFNLSAAALPYGPYLSAMPADPVNGRNTVKVIGNNQPMPLPDGSTGWIYQPQTQTVIANVVGKDDSGTYYSTY